MCRSHRALMGAYGVLGCLCVQQMWRVQRVGSSLTRKSQVKSGKFSKCIMPFSNKRLNFNLSNDRHPNKLPENLLPSVLEYRNQLFIPENGKKSMHNVSTIPGFRKSYFKVGQLRIRLFVINQLIRSNNHRIFFIFYLIFFPFLSLEYY